jgi:hypothetical protein
MHQTFIPLLHSWPFHPFTPSWFVFISSQFLFQLADVPSSAPSFVPFLWYDDVTTQCNLQSSPTSDTSYHDFNDSRFLLVIPFYLQSVPVHSAICVKKKRVQCHVEECSLALLCNWYVQSLMWFLRMRITNQTLKIRITNTTVTLGIW